MRARVTGNRKVIHILSFFNLPYCCCDPMRILERREPTLYFESFQIFAYVRSLPDGISIVRLFFPRSMHALHYCQTLLFCPPPSCFGSSKVSRSNILTAGPPPFITQQRSTDEKKRHKLREARSYFAKNHVWLPDCGGKKMERISLENHVNCLPVFTGIMQLNTMLFVHGILLFTVNEN